jgi:diadenosine tetraphosphate (Ap4A) HIT family hydrolase
VCFDAAPLMPGHIIIHSREHYGCAGELPFDDLAPVRRLADEWKQRIRAEFGSATVYEHGRAGHCLTDGPQERLCHHFHLHVVPGDYDLHEVLAARFPAIPIPDYTSMNAYHEQYGDYLFLETDDGRAVYYPVDHAIERHLMRTLIADRLGRPERADWSSYADPALLADGIAVLRPTAPADPVDAVLRRAWVDALDLPGIADELNFFSAGGHSLSAMLVMDRVEAELGIAFPLDVLFDSGEYGVLRDECARRYRAAA